MAIRLRNSSARPQDLQHLMQGVIAANERMQEGELDSVLQATATAFGFVHIHPFQNGNGRLHRCLIHHVLAARARELRGVHTDGAFLFPQMMLTRHTKREIGEQCWSPGFVDYLFLAFNTSAAFSPTDSPVLSSWAKLLMMVLALISFATVALLAARAVNIL